MNSLYKRYKSSTIINRFVNLFSVDVLIKASGFILLPIYLKLMTQTEFGFFNYLLSIVGFFSQILNFGLFVSQSKIYHEVKGDQKGSYVFTLQITLLLLLLPTILVIYLTHFDSYIINLLFKNPIDYKTYRFPLLFAILVSVYSFMLYNYLLTAEQIKHVQRFNVIKLVLLHIVVIFVLYHFNNKIFSRLMATYTVELLLVTFFFYYMIKEMVPKFRTADMYRSIKIGLPVMSAAICGVVINFGDKFLLEKRAGFLDLSIYYLAFTIAGFVPLLFNTIQNIWLPIFLKEKDLKKNLVMTKKLFWALAGLYLFLAAAVMLLIKVALHYNYINMQYNTVLFILPIVLVSLIIDSLTHLFVNYVTLFEQTFVLPVISVVVGVVSIISNVLLIKYYGLYGAAYSSLFINVFGFIIFYLLFRYNLYKYNLKNQLAN